MIKTLFTDTGRLPDHQQRRSDIGIGCPTYGTPKWNIPCSTGRGFRKADTAAWPNSSGELPLLSGISCQQCDTKLQAYKRLFPQVLWYVLKTTKWLWYNEWNNGNFKKKNLPANSVQICLVQICCF